MFKDWVYFEELKLSSIIDADHTHHNVEPQLKPYYMFRKFFIGIHGPNYETFRELISEHLRQEKGEQAILVQVQFTPILQNQGIRSRYCTNENIFDAYRDIGFFFRVHVLYSYT